MTLNADEPGVHSVQNTVPQINPKIKPHEQGSIGDMRDILPDAGIYFAAAIEGKATTHDSFDTKDQLAEFNTRFSSSTANVYHACTPSWLTRSGTRGGPGTRSS